MHMDRATGEALQGILCAGCFFVLAVGAAICWIIEAWRTRR